jgi:chromosome segregation ATPase
MSEETTRDLPDARSFEERVFARFDGMDMRFDGMELRFDARFDGLDSRVQALEARAFDTKPIWERALSEILEVKQDIAGVKQDVAGVKQDVAEVKQDVAEVKGRVEGVERKLDVVILDMMQLRGDQRSINKRMDALESQPQ